MGVLVRQCVFVSWTVRAAFAESDFWGKLDAFDSYMQSPFLESLPKIPSVVAAWVFIYCVLPKENQERRLAAVSRRSVQPHRRNEGVWMRFCFTLVSLDPIGINHAPFWSVFKFLFYTFSSTYHKTWQGLLAHYKTTMVVFLHTDDYCSPHILLLKLMLMKILLY